VDNEIACRIFKRLGVKEKLHGAEFFLEKLIVTQKIKRLFMEPQ
jgi:hypothetical protein